MSHDLDQSVLNTLSQVSLFEGLTPHQLQIILQAAHHRHIPRHGYFFHQGEEATRLYVLLQGKARLTQITPEGQQVIIHLLGPGDPVAIIVVLSHAKYPVTARAHTHCDALSWERDSITRLMEQYGRLSLNGLKMVSERFLEMQDRYRELATERVERRIARALLRQINKPGNGRAAPLKITLSRQDLAEMTGTTLYTVSRTCSSWEQQGLITAGRGRITICNYTDFLNIAEDLPR